MRDLISNLGVKIAIPAASYDADNTPAAIDLRGFDSAVFAIHCPSSEHLALMAA